MNKFAALQCFVAAAEEGSFSAAGRKLGMSGSKVTKTIGRLEDDLRARLFNRTTRQLALTKQGQELFDRAQRILQDLAEAESRIHAESKNVQGTVRIVVPNLFGRLALIPSLGEFYDRYPGIRLQVHFSGNPVDLIEAGFDLGVHTGELEDSRTIRRQLTTGPMITAASQSYLDRYGVPETPQDLLEHNCIHGRFGVEWAFKSEVEGRQRVRIAGNLAVYNADVLREAAVKGLGIVHSSWWALKDDLQAGRLVAILEEYQIEALPISVVFPAGRYLPARVRAVIDYLIEITAN